MDMRIYTKPGNKVPKKVRYSLGGFSVVQWQTRLELTANHSMPCTDWQFWLTAESFPTLQGFWHTVHSKPYFYKQRRFTGALIVYLDSFSKGLDEIYHATITFGFHPKSREMRSTSHTFKVHKMYTCSEYAKSPFPSVQSITFSIFVELV
jgi:hypothetical protein